MIFDARGLSFSYGNKKIFDNLSIKLERGKFYGILGPNGSGKTTFLDLLSSHHEPASGSIMFNGKDLSSYSKKQLAKRIAIVPQNYYSNFPFTVEDIVMMGRYPYIPRFSRPTLEDVDLVQNTMHQTQVYALRNRYITELSSGERQRVVFTRALVQETPVLMLDEATSNLDVRHTIDLMTQVSEKVKGSEGAVISVFQDINLASVYCDDLIFFKNGRVVVYGEKETVLNTETIKKVFDVDSKIVFEPFINAQQVVFRKEQC